MTNSPRVQRLNQVFAHVITNVPDVHLGPIRIEVNFHLHYDTRRKGRVGIHSHPWWDVSMVREGKIKYGADGQTVALGKNQIVLLPNGVMHEWKAEQTPLLVESYMLGVFAQNTRGEMVISEIRRQIAEQGYCFNLSKRLRTIREDLWLAADEYPAGSLQAARIGQLMQFFIVYLFAELFGRHFVDEDGRFIDGIAQAPGNVKLVARIEEYLRNHLAERITIKDLQRQFSYSHRHLSRLFKQQTGSSIQQYLLTKRIRAACDLLMNSGVRTKEAAHMVGFTDVSYFCRIFREHMRFTPQKYQEHYRK